jgi:Protein of unknown function (DUF559)
MSEPPWPFIGTEALANRLIPEHAMRTRYEQLYPGVYVPREVDPSAVQRAKAAWLWSRRRGVLAGTSAAAVLGVKWIDGDEDAELIHLNRRAPADLIVRTEALAAREVTRIDGMRVTTSARTAFDYGRHIRARLRAVKRLDALACATGVTIAEVEAIAEEHRGAKGLPRLRKVLPLMDGGAESPQETVARLALIDAGLPAPSTQVKIFGRFGEFLARVDMAYEDVKVAIEYDGPQHWEDPAVRQRDIDKHFELPSMGWHVIRVSRDLLKFRRATYIHRVETALRKRGLEW